MAESQWTLNLDNLVLQFCSKCSKRILLHRESAHYYARQLRLFTIPGGILGAIGSSAVFAMWKGELCAAAWHQYTLLASGICMVLSTALGALVSKSQYPALYAVHIKSYRAFDKLLKKLTVELSFEPHMRTPVRDFIQNMIADYDRYTDEAELAPRAVEESVAKMLLDAQQQADDAQMDLEAQRRFTGVYHPVAPAPDSLNEGDDQGRRHSNDRQNMRRESKRYTFRTRANDKRGSAVAANDIIMRNLMHYRPSSTEQSSSPRTSLSNNNNERANGTGDRVRFADETAPLRFRTEAQRRESLAVAMTSQRRRMAAQYCKRMPLSSIIEMDAPTYEEQISSSTIDSYSAPAPILTYSGEPHHHNLRSPSAEGHDHGRSTDGAKSVHTHNAQQRAADGSAERPQRRKSKVRKKASEKTRQRVGTVAGGQEVHSELVQSAVASGMNDVTASHPSDQQNERESGADAIDALHGDVDECDSCDSRDLDRTVTANDSAGRIVVERRSSIDSRF